MKIPVKVSERDKKNSILNLFMGVSFIILLIISGFRGDFTSEYRSYTNLFYYYNTFSITEILKSNFYEETGYVLFNKFIGIFTDNSVYLTLITSIIIFSGN